MRHGAAWSVFKDPRVMPLRLSQAAAFAAIASLVASPLSAADHRSGLMPVVAGELGSNAANAHQYWGGHYGHGGNHIDEGDVIAGVLVIGAIAAIASAAGHAGHDNDYRYPQSYPQQYPVPERPYDYRTAPADTRYDSSRGLDRAVDTCVREIERDSRVNSVDGVARSDTGWRVSGQLAGGEPFTCAISSDGRIETIERDPRGALNDRQWDDQRYAAARQAQDGAAAPSYPGEQMGGEAAEGYGASEAGQVPDLPG
jgi:hypothetical protein